MDAEMKEVLASLGSRHMHAVLAETREDAVREILGLVPRDAVVGIGDSTTNRQLGAIAALQARGTKVLNPFEREAPKGGEAPLVRLRRLLNEATLSDVFLTGANAITRDGRLISLDAVGNRVAGMFWGHPTSIVVAGRNKIVRDLEEGLQRVKKVIAPNHVRIRTELGGGDSRTPCAVTGECSDCRAPDRICNIYAIIEGKPYFTEMHVVIVNEDLGLGWDPSWPEDRIARIRDRYRELVWVPVPRR
jgi:hypothetical protein